MRIERMELEHFGLFSHRKIELRPGLNLIYGKNEAGKTTLYSFIKGMLFGIEKGRGRQGKKDLYERYRPWDTPSLYGGCLELAAGDGRYRIVRSFYKETREAYYVDLNTGRKEEIQGALPFLPGTLTREAYENTIGAGQGEEPVKKELAALLKNRGEDGAAEGRSVDVAKALTLLHSREREIEKKGTASLLLQIDRELERIEEAGRQWEERGRDLEQAQAVYREKEAALYQEKENSRNQHGEPVSETTGARRLPCLPLLLAGALGILIGSACFFSPGPARSASPVFLISGLLLFFIGLLSKSATLSKSVIKGRVKTEAEITFPGQMDARRKQLEEERVKIERIRWEMQGLEETLCHREEWLLKREECLRELAREQEDQKALALAETVLKEILDEQKKEAGLPLGKRLTELFGVITGGRYEGVYVSGELDFTVREERRAVDGIRLSGGTAEQMLLGLRITAGELLLQEEEMPLLLDDGLAYYDDERMGRTLSLLSGLDRQVLLFTCQKREAEYLTGKGIDFHYVVL